MQAKMFSLGGLVTCFSAPAASVDCWVVQAIDSDRIVNIKKQKRNMGVVPILKQKILRQQIQLAAKLLVYQSPNCI